MHILASVLFVAFFSLASGSVDYEDRGEDLFKWAADVNKADALRTVTKLHNICKDVKKKFSDQLKITPLSGSAYERRE